MLWVLGGEERYILIRRRDREKNQEGQEKTREERQLGNGRKSRATREGGVGGRGAKEENER